MKHFYGVLQDTADRYRIDAPFRVGVCDKRGNITLTVGGKEYLLTEEDRDKLVKLVYENFELVQEPTVKLKARDY